MSWLQLSLLANVATSVLIAVAGVAAVIEYHRTAPWESSGTGRHVMAMTVTITLFGAYTVAIWLWPHGIAAVVLRVIRVLVGLGMAGLLAQRALIFHHGPRHDRKRGNDDAAAR